MKAIPFKLQDSQMINLQYLIRIDAWKCQTMIDTPQVWAIDYHLTDNSVRVENFTDEQEWLDRQDQIYEAMK